MREKYCLLPYRPEHIVIRKLPFPFFKEAIIIHILVNLTLIILQKRIVLLILPVSVPEEPPYF